MRAGCDRTRGDLRDCAVRCTIRRYVDGMAPRFDHTIVRVNDLEQSVAFWVEYLGLTDAGRDGPFAVLRVDAGSQIQLAPWGTEGN